MNRGEVRLGQMEGVALRLFLGRRREVRFDPGHVKEGRVLIVVRTSDDRGGRSLVIAGALIKDIQMEPGVSALGLVFVKRQFGEGKGDDEALDGWHADEGQPLHGAE